jgi:SSS family solute:Na+ symporter
MTILGLNIIDVVVIVVYFLAMLYVGYLAMKRIKGQEDFFLGGRSFGKFFQTFSMFGQATSAESAVSMSSTVAQKGLAGVFYSAFSGLFTLPIFWFTALWMRRSRLMTLADLFTERFQSKKLAGMYALAQVCFFILVGAMGLQAMSKTIMAVTVKPVSALSQAEKSEYDQAIELKTLESKPADLLSAAEKETMDSLRRLEPRENFSYFNKTILIISMAIFVMLYAAGGGLEAAVWTDAIQSVFILMLTVLMFPFAMLKMNSVYGYEGFTGAFKAVHNILPGSMLELLGSPKLAGWTWHYMLLLALVGVAGSFAFSNNLVVAGAAKSEEAARAGSMNGLILKRVSTVFWAMLALFILTLYGIGVSDPDLLWGVASKSLLPVGLLGLMLACLLAALMSTTDTHMVVVSGLITRNIYKPFAENKPDSHYLKMGRIFGLVHITGGVFVALFGTSNLLEMMIFMLLLNVTMGPAILMAFLWRKTNTIGVWVSMGGALLLTLVIPLAASWIPAVRNSTAFQQEIQPPTITRSYTAKEWDVSTRQKAIDEWNALNSVNKAKGQCPKALVIGEHFEQPFIPPAFSIFWEKGIKTDKDGLKYGSGKFRADLYLLHKLGLDLSKLSVAANKSLSLALKLLFPFSMLIIFGLFGKQNDDDVCDRFYARLLTPVNPDHEADKKEVAATVANPHIMDEKKLLPGSDWNFRKWDWQDWKGIVISAVSIICIGGLMLFMANLGK